MIRVTIPIDVQTVAQTGSSAFALLTPLSVEDIIGLAIDAALGPRAPEDKRRRIHRTTLAGFEAGAFAVDIDGLLYRRADAIVACAGSIALRFFITEPQPELGSTRQ